MLKYCFPTTGPKYRMYHNLGHECQAARGQWFLGYTVFNKVF